MPLPSAGSEYTQEVKILVPNNRSSGATPPAGRYSGGRGAGVSESVSWSAVDPQILWDTINAVTSAGDLCSFSRTLDGGALHFRILSAGKSYPYYWPSVEDAHNGLRIVLDEAQR